MTRAFRAIRLALAFLTILPIRVGEGEATPGHLADARFAGSETDQSGDFRQVHDDVTAYRRSAVDPAADAA